MSNSYELGTARTIGRTQATGREVFPLQELGFDPRQTESRLTYRPSEAAYYLLVADGSRNFHVFKENDALRNSWEQVSPDGGYSLDVGSISYPLVTHDETLIVGLTLGGDDEIVRMDDWGQTQPETVFVGFTPLYMKNAQDYADDIFVGAYGPNGDGRVIKSTDDGQTWSTIYTGTQDTHIHAVTPAWSGNILHIAWGDNNFEDEFIRKDGTNSVVESAARYLSTQYKSVPVIQRRLSGADDVTPGGFIAGNDASACPITLTAFEAHFKSDDVLSFQLRGAVKSKSHLQHKGNGNTFISDIIYAGGRYVAWARGENYLYVSDDGGRFWDTIPVRVSGRPEKAISSELVEGQRHIALYGESLLLVPKEVVYSVEPNQTTHVLADGSQTLQSGDIDLLRMSLDDVSEIEYFAVSDNASHVSVRQYASDRQNGNNIDTELWDAAAPTSEQGSVTFRGGAARIRPSGADSFPADLRAIITLKK